MPQDERCHKKKTWGSSRFSIGQRWYQQGDGSQGGSQIIDSGSTQDGPSTQERDKGPCVKGREECPTERIYGKRGEEKQKRKNMAEKDEDVCDRQTEEYVDRQRGTEVMDQECPHGSPWIPPRPPLAGAVERVGPPSPAPRATWEVLSESKKQQIGGAAGPPSEPRKVRGQQLAEDRGRCAGSSWPRTAEGARAPAGRGPRKVRGHQLAEDRGRCAGTSWPRTAEGARAAAGRGPRKVRGHQLAEDRGRCAGSSWPRTAEGARAAAGRGPRKVRGQQLAEDRGRCAGAQATANGSRVPSAGADRASGGLRELSSAWGCTVWRAGACSQELGVLLRERALGGREKSEQSASCRSPSAAPPAHAAGARRRLLAQRGSLGGTERKAWVAQRRASVAQRGIEEGLGGTERKAERRAWVAQRGSEKGLSITARWRGGPG
ncbi:hypothetical protein NDU88_000825 [Pleurodeles waltl]|uniref:Uncharacterized protein n=1 Tax=Pleurodeles waltl TaxID=8319 RepID=A0AAV7LWN1_PLEWA|nr:hypothetical protein NDU88_000825 [Pleurodeles waltl]